MSVWLMCTIVQFLVLRIWNDIVEILKTFRMENRLGDIGSYHRQYGAWGHYIH